MNIEIRYHRLHEVTCSFPSERDIYKALITYLVIDDLKFIELTLIHY